MINFQTVATSALTRAATLVPEWLPNGKQRGHEWVVGGINGEPGESLSVNIKTGQWADFANPTQKGGDLISLYAEINHITQAEAARQLGGGDTSTAVAVVKAAPADDWTILSPVPEDAPEPFSEHPKHGRPDHIARYRDRTGALLGVIYRFDPPRERKQVVSLTFREHKNGRRKWGWKAMAKPRPLYGLDRLRDGDRVLIVEGEKKCEAARRMLTGYAISVVSWQGGSSAVANADWSTLSGRDCIIWPDNDAPGFKAADAVTIQLRHHGAKAMTVGLPDGLEGGWDLADAEREGWDGARVMAQIDPQPVGEWDAPPDFDFGEPMPQAEHEIPEFVPLGHDSGRFFFFSSSSGQVRDFSAKDLHSQSALTELARLRYWEMNYPGKEGCSARAAGDALISMCHKTGIYDPSRIRGRGAWIDDGRSILHLGDRLIVDGEESALVLPKSRYIYEHSTRAMVDLGKSLSTPEANKLRALCAAAPWEEPDHMGQLLAGWCVIAPVCGAMPWRPHLWLAGEAGSGKTWVIDNIIKPLIGQVALPVQSKTTEAGIRQTLRCNAIPVIFDEAETQNEEDRKRMQLVLDLARQASSEDGAAIVKGSSGGKASQYRVRSCFLFSSINVGLSQTADEGRVVVLTLKQDTDAERKQSAYKQLQKLHAEVMTREFAGRLLARTLKLLPFIRKNADVFADAIARSGKSRRMGDTYGVLMAGAWSLRSSKVATAAEADRMVAETPWVVKATAGDDVEPDWKRAFDALLQYRTPARSEDIPIGELITASKGDDGGWAAKELSRIGISVRGDTIWIGNGVVGVAKIFDRTPWANSWQATLRRTPGAKANVGTRLLGGVVKKCFSIPI